MERIEKAVFEKIKALDREVFMAYGRMEHDEFLKLWDKKEDEMEFIQNSVSPTIWNKAVELFWENEKECLGEPYIVPCKI